MMGNHISMAYAMLSRNRIAAPLSKQEIHQLPHNFIHSRIGNRELFTGEISHLNLINSLFFQIREIQNPKLAIMVGLFLNLSIIYNLAIFGIPNRKGLTVRVGNGGLGSLLEVTGRRIHRSPFSALPSMYHIAILCLLETDIPDLKTQVFSTAQLLSIAVDIKGDFFDFIMGNGFDLPDTGIPLVVL